MSIKRLLLIFLMILSLVLTQMGMTATATLEPIKGTVKNISLEVKEKPSPKAKKIGTLKKGTVIYVYNSKPGGWSEIRFNNKISFVATSGLNLPKLGVVKPISKEKQLEQRVDKILNEIISKNMSEEEKAYQIFNYVQHNVIYELKEDDPTIYTAYGALVMGSAVCTGRAKAVQLLLNKLNIETKIVYSSYQLNHAWNLVKINKTWYHLDATMNAFLKSDTFMDSGKKDEFWYWDKGIYPKAPKNTVSPQGWYIELIGDKLYYNDESNNTLAVSKLDGSEKRTVRTNNDVAYWDIEGDWLYYSGFGGSTEIYRTSLSNPSKEQSFMIQGSLDNFKVIDGKIFYTKDGIKKSIYILNPETNTMSVKTNVTLQKLMKENLEDAIRLIR